MKSGKLFCATVLLLMARALQGCGNVSEQGDYLDLRNGGIDVTKFDKSNPWGTMPAPMATVPVAQVPEPMQGDK